MDLTDKKQLINFLKENRIWPKRKLGQNFLINQEVIDKMVETAKLTSKDFVLEIGPGLGILTRVLLQTGAKVFSIEKDRDFCAILEKSFHQKNFTLKCADALLEIKNLNLPKNYKVVASIPFQISSPLIQLLLSSSNKPKTMVILMQYEVAQRIAAKPGESERGFLTVLVENLATSKIIQKIDKENFYPIPEVDAAILLIKTKTEDFETSPFFFRLVKAGFASKRQQIANSFSNNLALPKEKIIKILKDCSLDPKLRAEDLALEEWYGLDKQISKFLKQSSKI